jgi:N4-gp56 family major capsid protein
MPDLIQGGSSAAGINQLSNQVLTSYNKLAYFALREGLVFDQFSTVKPGDVTNPGTPVSWNFWTELSAITSTLAEGVDVDAVNVADSQVTVTPAEYGNAVILTLRLRTDAYLIGFDQNIANLLNFNLVDSMDGLARTALNAPTNISYAVTDRTSTTFILSTDLLTIAGVREERATLRSASVVPWDGSNYGAIVHPDVGYDFKAATGDGSWSSLGQYSDPASIWNDEIGLIANVRFMESPRARLQADAATGTVDAYSTYFFGQEFLAKAEPIPAHMVVGPVTDKLQRFSSLGWHAYVAWTVFRQASIRIIKTASSIGDN